MNSLNVSPVIVNLTRVISCVFVCLTLALPATAVAQDDKPSLTAELKKSFLRELAATSLTLGDAERGKAIFQREQNNRSWNLFSFEILCRIVS